MDAKRLPFVQRARKMLAAQKRMLHAIESPVREARRRAERGRRYAEGAPS